MESGVDPRRWAGAAVGAAVLALAGLATGCATGEAPRDYEPVVARFFAEARSDEAAISVTLPYSGSAISISPKPVFVEYDIANVELVRVDLGLCLFFQFTPDASRDFYRYTLSNRGRRLVLLLNQQPVGARLIDQPIANGGLMLFVEVPEADLPELVNNLRGTSAEIQREARRQTSLPPKRGSESAAER